MSTTTPVTRVVALPTERWGTPTAAQVLVIGGSALAPLNLLLVKSFTVYDFLIGVAFLLLLGQRQLRMPPTRYLVAAHVFLLAALFSAFRATYPVEALTQVLTYVFVFFLLVPVVYSVVRSRRAVLASVFFLCAGTLGAILHAFLTQHTQGAGRVLVFYSENPNRLGYPAAYLLPFLVVLWLGVRTLAPRYQFVAGLACLGSGYLVVWSLAASASRSSMLGALVALFVFIVARPSIGVGRMLLRAGGLTAGLALVGVLLASTGQLPTTLEDRIERSFSAEDQGKLVGDREHLNNAGIRAFVDSPFLGTGLDNFRYVTVDYDQEATPQLPHNLWLQLLVQVGVFGTLAFAAIFVTWFRDLGAAYARASALDRQLLWAMASAFAGVLVIFLFAPELLDRHYWLIVTLGLAIVDGVRRHDPRKVIAS
ncbi:MAG: O-antigen ligase family protein [Nocardioidaceae bacterium]